MNHMSLALLHVMGCAGSLTTSTGVGDPPEAVALMGPHVCGGRWCVGVAVGVW